MTPTPRERVRYALSQAHAIGDVEYYRDEFENNMVGLVTSAISDQTAALQAALEDLARVQSERDAMQDEIRCVRLRAQSAEGLARMAEQRQSRLEMELQASRADYRTTQGCYETELAARNAVEQERDGLAAATELIGNTLLRVEINPANYTHEEVCALNDAASVAFQLADHDMGPAALASHDRQVAARVLREAEGYVVEPIECSTLLRLADQYERGEREVPA